MFNEVSNDPDNTLEFCGGNTPINCICVPNYEKCLKQDDSIGTGWCLPNLEQKSEDCEDETWDKLQEKFAKPNDLVSPCLESVLDDLVLGTGYSFNLSDTNIDLDEVVLAPGLS